MDFLIFIPDNLVQSLPAGDQILSGGKGALFYTAKKVAKIRVVIYNRVLNPMVFRLEAAGVGITRPLQLASSPEMRGIKGADV